MQPFAEFPKSGLAAIDYVLTDIDDTVTTSGRFPSSSLQAMERLEATGVKVIPVTGRPAGWCDHIARMWPVSAVVGENGALYFSYDRTARQMHTWYARGEEEVRRDRERLAKLAERVLHEIPGSALASDQPYRLADLAIDFCEDVPRLPDEAVGRIVTILREAGATTKVSSIHVNTWFGSHDKLTTSRKCLFDLFELDCEKDTAQLLFSGDSPNDEPMFAYFHNSVAVANIRDFTLENEPSWVTTGHSADGFVEIATAIVNAKQIRT